MWLKIVGVALDYDLPVSIPSAPALHASIKDALVFSAVRGKVGVMK